MPKSKKNSKKVLINVIKIKDGVVEECSLHTNVKDAEEEFTLGALDLGAKKEDMDDHLSDGYCLSRHLNKSVCLVWPKLKKRPT
jgi:hypothetical protein